MSNTNSLKNLYGLECHDEKFHSSLTIWYNQLINKSVDELNVADVAKMIRQDILRNVAINRAVELFLKDPFDGEMQDGDILALLVSCGSEIVRNNKVKSLIALISGLEEKSSEFDWTDEETQKLFGQNVTLLKEILLQGDL